MPSDNDIVCIKQGNISYCWNFETCQLEIYTKKTGTINDCPKDVANKLMRLISEKISPAEKAKGLTGEANA